VQKFAKILGLPENIPYRRLLLEKVVPRLSDLLGLGPATSYKDIFIATLEKAALHCKLERFRVYDFHELLDSVLENYHISSDTISDKIPRLLKQSEIVIKPVKEHLIQEIVDVFVSELRKVNKAFFGKPYLLFTC